MPEAHVEIPSKTAAPSQESTMMPSSYYKTTTLGVEGNSKDVVIGSDRPLLF